MFKYPVSYFTCSVCGSLQTEQPYWLEEAYLLKTEQFNAGKASRTVDSFLILPRLLEILDIHRDDRSVDSGGGTGLLARLMRDIGYNFHTYDTHGSGELCAGYRWDTFDRPVKLVTLFDSPECFVNPASEWEAIFSAGPDYILGTTGIFDGQGSDWSGLSPESGRKVFFHSTNAIAHIASKRGWNCYLIGSYFLMTRIPLSERARGEMGDLIRNLAVVRSDGFQLWQENLFESASIDNQRLVTLAQLRSCGKRIAIDGYFFRFATGISRLWRSLLAEWSANGFGEFLLVIDRAKTAPRYAGIRYVDAPQYDYAAIDQDRAMLQSICDRENIGLFISTYYTIPLTTPSALLVLDMIPEVLGFDLSNPQWVGKRHAIEYAQAFLSISHSTERDLVRFFPEVQMTTKAVTYCGCDFRTAGQEQIDAFKVKYGIQRPYFLISGARAGQKNAELFFKAFARLGEERSDFSIVCTNANTPLEAESAIHLGGALVYMVALNDDDLQSAYSGAVALSYPSRYEGFGLPVVEAMACSCPVITCRNSSLAEVGGEAVIYVDPDSVDQMHQALLDVQLPSLREELVARGLQKAKQFSWLKMSWEVGQHLAGWAMNSPQRIR